jgi:hypothetical protein
MDRADATGFSVALIGHALVIAVLAFGLIFGPILPPPPGGQP